MSHRYRKKSISWYQLWRKIGRQPLCRIKNTKVQILIDGELKEGCLVFINNGSDFYLQII